MKYVTADCDLPYMKLSQGSILITNAFAYIDLRQSKVLRLRVFLEKSVAISITKNLPDFYATRGLIIMFTKDHQ